MNTIPEQHRQALSSAIAKGEFDSMRSIIEANNIDLNAYEEQFHTPILMGVLTSYGIKNENERVEMLRYLLENGANPNLNCKAGYNSLHVAVQQQRLIKPLDLFLDFGGDVNLADNNGGTVAYWAIQSFPWRTEGEERQFHLKVLEKIFMAGADLDRKNKYGVTPRIWLERSAEDVKDLAGKCEKLKPVYKASETQQPEFPTKLKYPEIAKHIRTNLIPVRGKADTTEGEMLRGLDNLRDEAHRNGNVNFGKTHKEYADFIASTLTQAPFFDKKEKDKISSAAKKLTYAKKPYLEDDVFDYLTDQICVYYKQKNA
ncbi:ankyrin repeat domain-containing protein [Pedobacter sp. GR22-6]|uniref:ankyrin repeat domain-containing protein n=1 Tax=Pedobacter sp. GR22-6 TaxID=3127957 RepID=UPI00307F1B90